MKHKFILIFSFCLIFLFQGNITNSQVLISGETGTVGESAMLEVRSTTQGILIPRMETGQRASISNPANGLLVYDTDLNAFFLFGGGSWINLSSSAEIWKKTASNVYLTDGTENVGIGLTPDTAKFVIQADLGDAADDVLFEVRDQTGVPIFRVTSEGVRIYIKPADKAVSGGFAVGQYGSLKDKAIGDDYLIVTPDSTRIYSLPTTKGVAGGFAVGQYSSLKGGDIMPTFYSTVDSTRVFIKPSTKGVAGGFAVGQYGSLKDKSVGDDFLLVTTDSTRVFTLPDAKGVSGGFAVGQYGSLKGGETTPTFYTTIDSTRVYIVPTTKGVSGGFAVGQYSSLKGDKSQTFYTDIDSTTINVEDSVAGFNVINVGNGKEERFMKMNTENTRIGHEAGDATTPGSGDVGKYNSFIGYRAGYTNITGKRNVCIGDHAGYTNKSDYNVFIGDQTGFSNDNGRYNLFMGFQSGYDNVGGDGNLFLGYQSGHENTNGHRNVFIGYNCGYNNLGGTDNLFLGNLAGQWSTTGGNNIFLGNQAGQGNYAGTNNVYIGYQAGRSIVGGIGNVFIGNQAGYSGTRSNELIIDNINTATPLIWGDFTADSLVINGDLTYTGVLTNASDFRLKTNLMTLTNVLPNLEKIRGVYFNWKTEIQNIPGRDAGRQIGVIAQELEEVYPELVYTNKEGLKTVDYTKLSAILIEAVKEQQDQIESQQNDIDKLKEENKLLKKQQEFILQEIQTIKNTNKTK